MKRKRFFLGTYIICAILLISAAFLTSCRGKDGAVGPMGPQGPAGTDGTNGIDGTNGLNGQDANETCKLCHNPTTVDATSTQYDLSKHATGTTAVEEAGIAACAPCHESEGFKFVCANSIPSTFTLNVGTGKYLNDYSAPLSAAYGQISCFTCHSQLHTTYGASDLSALTTIAPVPMTMWGGNKTINLTQDGGISNLCVKCHQPRPMTKSTVTSDGNVFDYASMIVNPTGIFYDTLVTTNPITPSYRTGIHYGSVGAIFAGVGGIEFVGSLSYSNSPHKTQATCQDCHMAAMSGASGDHTFKAKGNFNGCNVIVCHGNDPISSTYSAYWNDIRYEMKSLLTTLANKINSFGVAGHPILHSDATETNLWAGLTTGNYDGYLDIYSSSSNPLGYYGKTGNPKFPSLTNAQMGAILNFQLVLREYSLGIHNTKYTRALLQNTIEQLP